MAETVIHSDEVVALLRDKYSYDEVEGVITERKTGQPANITVTRTGYGLIRPQFNGKRVRLLVHRLAWLLHYGDQPTELDHIDRDKTNNRINNLRVTSRRNNNFNQGVRSDSKSGVKNITWNSQKSKWQLYKDRTHYGFFSTVNAAVEAKEALKI